jgi:hypothetical protein
MSKLFKNEEKYSCKQCNFVCKYNSNYISHLNTAKHKRMTDNDTLNDNKMRKHEAYHSCECGKQYKYRQGLHAHKNVCKSNNVVSDDIVINKSTDNGVENSDNSKESLILTLITQNKELMTMLASQQQEHKEETRELVVTIQEQSNTIKDIIPKIGNNNNNTTNNKFNLQVFLNEDCKDAINFTEFIESIQVTVEDLENQAQLGYVGGISKLFLENMKELGINKRPIHCTDKKRNTLYIKENNEWEKEGSQDQLLHGIKVVTGRAHQTLCDMKEDNPEEYSDMDSDFSNKCVNIQRSLLPVFPRETTFEKVIDSISGGSVVDKE